MSGHFTVCPSNPNFRKTFMGMVFPRFQEPSMPVMVNNWRSRFFCSKGLRTTSLKHFYPLESPLESPLWTLIIKHLLISPPTYRQTQSDFAPKPGFFGCAEPDFPPVFQSDSIKY